MTGSTDAVVGAGDGRGDSTILRVTDLEVSIHTDQGPVRAVNGVSLDLEAGRTLGLVGESGSGKSMLAKAIMRLLPPGSVVGPRSEVWFDGADIYDLSPRELGRRWGADMGLILQDPMTALTPVVRVGRQIMEPLRAHLGLSKADAHSRAVELLRHVGIPEPERRMRSYPHELSGGMRQRVLIAIALSCEPKLLIADEPTTALDVTVQQQILNLLGRAQQEHEMTTILVTHDLGVAAGRTDDIAVMYAGRIVERAPTPTFFDAMRHPYSVGLIGSVPRADARSQTELRAVPGRPPTLIGDLPAGCAFAPRCEAAQDRCRSEVPALTPASDDPAHEYACFFPVDPGSHATGARSAAGRGSPADVEVRTR
jgi:peptide/nickel transport system ATP-binding protein